MSKSRLEKFLYALYSLDSSDLPIPKSRIEELYNCLVTGAEVPTFKPISRVEKYLMAILGAYDVDSLPNPLSRVEVLLYKLATGDDNLDDIKSFLSEHEELLTGIIRNGGINGDISFDDDYEYRGYSFATGQYTLYNTKEHSMKNAALKGDTLVNIVKKQEKPFSHSADGISQNNNLQLSYSLKANTTYTRYIHVSALDLGTTSDVGMYDALIGDDGSYTQYPYNVTSKGWIINTFTTKTTSVSPYMINPDTNALSNGLIHMEIDKFMIIEGDHTQEDIPYFEGMKSVENPVMTTTGKNLFDVSRLPQTVNITPTSTGYTLTGYSCGTGMHMSGMFPNLIVGKKYVLSFQSSSSSIVSAQNSIGFYNANTEDLLYYRNNESFILTNEMYYERRVVLYGVNDETVEISNVQLEEGSVATEYEPYKSTTVSCNEDVELRGIGDVQDTLDCLTGELTQRIGEVVLDGSEYWNIEGEEDTRIEFSLFGKINDAALNGGTICNKIPEKIGDSEGITVQSFGTYVKISKTIASDVESFKTYLQSNPITVQYELAEPVIKTVDLSVVDQDGNDTELKTFDNSTHVAITSEGLVPESEIEVAKYIPYMIYELTKKETTLYNTKEHSVKSAILKGNTKYRDIDTGDILDTFDETKNLELVSVKMPVLTTTGKNLVFLDKNNPDALGSWSGNGSSEIKYDDEKQAFYTSIHRGMCSNISFKPNTYYIISAEFLLRKNDSYSFIWKNPQQSTGTTYSNDTPFNETTWIRKSIKRLSDNDGKIDWIVYGGVWFRNLQIEEAESLTEYESYKSNILTVNEDVVLRGIGDVKDELNLLTGELTQRIGEIVLDGSDDEDWTNATNGDGWYRHYMTNNLFGTDLAISDKYVYLRYLNDTNNISVVGKIALHRSVNGYLYVGTNLSLNDFKRSLYQNPITVQYALAEESVKTVDISVVDQDGNNTKLKSFDDITYVTLSSEGPIPEAELEVATKNEEVLDTMSLRMDDIYATQTTLEETSNTQSENVDATMFATTEIYEGLL